MVIWEPFKNNSATILCNQLYNKKLPILVMWGIKEFVGQLKIILINAL